jgi:hypothetical protein
VYILASIDDVENVQMENEAYEARLDMAHLRHTFSGLIDFAKLQRPVLGTS